MTRELSSYVFSDPDIVVFDSDYAIIVYILNLLLKTKF